MRHTSFNRICQLTVAFLMALPLVMMGQTEKVFYQRPTYWRPYDQTGINVFETPKKVTATTFEGLKIRFGAGFTQQFQNLKHENPGALNSESNTWATSNKIYPLKPGFMTAQANLYMDVELADGISLNVTSYLSARHHNEAWVKGGYIQFDKLPFKGQFWDNLMKMATIKVGHMEINYGDAHFRRSDGGNTIWNPWIENNIMDEFTTEIGAELYWQKNGIIAMAAMTDGEIQGNVSKPSTPDGAQRKPSLYGKVGYDKQLNEDLRVRLTGSYYTTKSSISNTLFGGDRTGSNYQYVMENAPVTLTGNAFSGRFNPGFRDNVTAMMINPFVKFKGLEVFGTWEYSYGKNSFENGEGTTWGSVANRSAHQTAAEALYRFGKNEKFYIGGRYIQVTATVANGVTATSAGTRDDVTIDRLSIGGGWFVTRNILLKGEYVNQNYDGYQPTSQFYKGNFKGVVIQGSIAF